MGNIHYDKDSLVSDNGKITCTFLITKYTVRKEIKCSGDLEQFHKTVCGTT